MKKYIIISLLSLVVVGTYKGASVQKACATSLSRDVQSIAAILRVLHAQKRLISSGQSYVLVPPGSRVFSQGNVSINSPIFLYGQQQEGNEGKNAGNRGTPNKSGNFARVTGMLGALGVVGAGVKTAQCAGDSNECKADPKGHYCAHPDHENCEVLQWANKYITLKNDIAELKYIVDHIKNKLAILPMTRYENDNDLIEKRLKEADELYSYATLYSNNYGNIEQSILKIFKEDAPRIIKDDIKCILLPELQWITKSTTTLVSSVLLLDRLDSAYHRHAEKVKKLAEMQKNIYIVLSVPRYGDEPQYGVNAVKGIRELIRFIDHYEKEAEKKARIEKAKKWDEINKKSVIYVF